MSDAFRRRLNRRGLLKSATAMSMASALERQAHVRAQNLEDVPRDRQLILVGGGVDGTFPNHDLWNGYHIGSSHDTGIGLIHEPLAYYSGFTDMTQLALADQWEFSDDSLQLKIGIRASVTWSDGQPFSAEDVAFTINAVRDAGPAIKMGAMIAPFVDEAVASSDRQVVVSFKVPAPRFMFLASYKYDSGLFILPKHVFEGKDLATFGNYDPAAGLPVTTGPWQVVVASDEEIVLDRGDSWWAVEQGLVSAMPEVERITFFPFASDDDAARGVSVGRVDSCSRLRPQTLSALLSTRPEVTTATGSEPPYGLIDWAPVMLYVNCDEEPFIDSAVRWALSYFLDRQALVENALAGAGRVSGLPIPSLPTLRPFADAASDLLAGSPSTQFDPVKGAELLDGAGWSNGGIAWVKSGVPLVFLIEATDEFADLGNLVSEQLNAQGVRAAFAAAPDIEERLASGEYSAAISRHRGSISGDPYYTLAPFQSKSQFSSAAMQSNFSRWRNDAFDAIVDELAVQPVDHFPALDPAVLIDLWKQALEIWLPELPASPLVETTECVPWNTRLWTGWPTEHDPHVSDSFKALMFQQVLNQLRSVS